MSTDPNGADHNACGAARSVIDLQHFACNERARIWRQAMCEKHFDMDIRFSSLTAPGGSIVHASVGPIGFSAMESVAQTHERTAQFHYRLSS